MDLRRDSPFRFWLSSVIETSLCAAPERAKAWLCSFGLLPCLVNYVVELRQSSDGTGRGGDNDAVLLAELIKFSVEALRWLSLYLVPSKRDPDGPGA